MNAKVPFGVSLTPRHISAIKSLCFDMAPKFGFRFHAGNLFVLAVERAFKAEWGAALAAYDREHPPVEEPEPPPDTIDELFADLDKAVEKFSKRWAG